MLIDLKVFKNVMERKTYSIFTDYGFSEFYFSQRFEIPSYFWLENRQ